MKNINFLKLLFSCLSISLIVACSDDDDDIKVPIESETYSISTKDYTKWYYFSFEEGDTLSSGSADPADGDDATWKARSDWDIAFHYKDIRTNSGKSGSANGGILEASLTVFSEIIEAPESGYAVDDSLDIRLSAAMPPVYTKSTASSVTDGWASYDHDEGAWIIAEKVFIVKTADGKYAKIWLKNFLDDEDNSGTITIEYLYQPDGSTSLE